MSLKGIDVSRWQGDIDWKKVKADGIQFAILKAGGADDGLYKDGKFEKNYSEAKAAGIPIGAYYFNSASFLTKEKAEEEARHFCELLKGKQFEFPVYCDIEAQDQKRKKEITSATIHFCEYMEANNYWVGIYSSDIAGFTDRLDWNAVSSYAKWIARYGGSLVHKEYGVRQYTDSGKVNGINGNVDLDEAVINYEPLIKDKGLNGFSKTTSNICSTFIPRLTRPTAGNKYYITKDCGGYSNAIKGKPTDSQCNVLSNCVGYAYGRFNEIGGYGYCKYLSPVNAENFIQYKGSLEVGQEPKLGACMVWQKGNTLFNSDGAGHVAIVEQIHSDGSITTSESGWNSSAFWTKKRHKGSNGNWGASSGYKFLGFIYQPIDYGNQDITENKKEEVKAEKPKTEVKLPTKRVIATNFAKKYSKDYVGKYKTSDILFCRNGAGTNNKSLCILPKDTTVKCHGYYTIVDDVAWLDITFALNGTLYTGFSSSKYLVKE